MGAWIASRAYRGRAMGRRAPAYGFWRGGRSMRGRRARSRRRRALSAAMPASSRGGALCLSIVRLPRCARSLRASAARPLCDVHGIVGHHLPGAALFSHGDGIVDTMAASVHQVIDVVLLRITLALGLRPERNTALHCSRLYEISSCFHQET